MVQFAWMRPPRHLLALFLAVTLLPAAGLVWLGWRLLEQDRDLEAQRMLERRENAAELIVSALRERLLAARQTLADPSRAPGLAAGDSVVVVLRPDNIDVHPAARLLFHPLVSTPPEAPRQLYLAGERYEFQQRDYSRAVGAFRELALSEDPAVRAGAQLRIARNHRKAGSPELALAAYERLAQLGGVYLDGVPASLAARRARCALLAELGRSEELQTEAKALYGDLLDGHWQLTGPAYELHAAQLRDWLGLTNEPEPERAALSAATEWLWEQWCAAVAGGPPIPQATTHTAGGRPFTILAHATGDSVSALIAGPDYTGAQWLPVVSPILEAQGVRVSLRDSAGNFVHGTPPAAPNHLTLRLATGTGLPWTVMVTNAGLPLDDAPFASRRRLLFSGLALAAILVIAGSYLIARAVSRELAVARLKSDFVSAVSHEFRTPLATLRQLTENLADGRVAGDERRKAYYEGQVRATNRLSRLVEGLLDFGRMEAGVLRYSPEPVQLGELVRSVVDEFEHVAATTGHRIETSIESPLPPVVADGEAVGQSVWNLLDNAIKYSPGQPVVWIEVAREDGSIAIRVRDKGLGIPREEHEHLFRKFVRGSAAREAEVKGTGIGLAMVDYIVRAHHGRIHLESAPGKGSTFTILLKTEAS